MINRRALYLTLIVTTLAVGIAIGTIVSGGVTATTQQKAEQLRIPDPVQLSSGFSGIAKTLETTVVNINTEATVESPVQGNGPVGPLQLL